MKRRDTLRSCAALGAAGGLGVLAGCSGGDGEESARADLARESFDFREGESGELVVTVTVTNDGSAEGTGDLYVTVTAAEPTTQAGTSRDENRSETDGDDDGTVAARRSREVTVPAGETETVEITFDVGYDQFMRNGSLDVDLRA